jgi:hypothetical protein
MRWLVIVTNYFLSWLCWKVSLGTTKIVNHAKKSKTCNWCMLPCCVLSLSKGRFVIGVYTSLESIYVVMWFRTYNYRCCQQLKVLLKCLTRYIKLTAVDNLIIILRTNMADGFWENITLGLNLVWEYLLARKLH